MSEYILNEDTKRQLLDKSIRNVDNYQDTSKGKNRFQRRTHSQVTRSNKYYNELDVNKLFKEDILNFNIKVIGETNSYLVTLEFPGVLAELSQLVPPYNDITYGDAVKAVSLAFENSDVKVRCSCPDFQYRLAFYVSQAGDIAGEREDRASDKTNPNDTKGRGCKHILKVLQNTGWINAIASVIRNYIIENKDHNESMYGRVIFPGIYHQPYDREYQLGLFDSDDLDSSPEAVDKANEYARTKNWFKPLPKKEFDPYNDKLDIEGQGTFDFDSLADEEPETEEEIDQQQPEVEGEGQE